MIHQSLHLKFISYLHIVQKNLRGGLFSNIFCLEASFGHKLKNVMRDLLCVTKHFNETPPFWVKNKGTKYTSLCKCHQSPDDMEVWKTLAVPDWSLVA